MRAHIEQINVDGKPVEVNLSELTVGDISKDMDRVASIMAYWGTVWASAEQEKERTDRDYRSWRAVEARKILADDPKIAEWKAKASIEASKAFRQFKEAIATAARNVVLARTQFDSYRVKSSILQSRGAMLRSEVGATDMVTKNERRPDQTERSAARDNLKKMNLKKPKA